MAYSSSNLPTIEFVLERYSKSDPHLGGSSSSFSTPSSSQNVEVTDAISITRPDPSAQVDVSAEPATAVDPRSCPSNAGQGLAETIERVPSTSKWTHLSTPNMTLQIRLGPGSTVDGSETVTSSGSSATSLQLQSSFPTFGGRRQQSQAGVSHDGQQRFLVQANKKILESHSLDSATLRSTKFRGLVKGNRIGFQYITLAHGHSVPEKHGFQVKFRSVEDCGQCATILAQHFERGSFTIAAPLIRVYETSATMPSTINSGLHTLSPILGSQDASQPLSASQGLESRPQASHSAPPSSLLSTQQEYPLTPAQTASRQVTDLEILTQLPEHQLRRQMYEILDDPMFPQVLLVVEKILDKH